MVLFLGKKYPNSGEIGRNSNRIEDPESESKKISRFRIPGFKSPYNDTLHKDAQNWPRKVSLLRDLAVYPFLISHSPIDRFAVKLNL